MAYIMPRIVIVSHTVTFVTIGPTILLIIGKLLPIGAKTTWVLIRYPGTVGRIHPESAIQNLIKLQILVALWGEPNPPILIHTGVSAHIFKNKSFVTSFDSNFDPESVSVILADGTVCNNITGKGTIQLTLDTSTGAKKQVTFTNVYLMPTLNHKGIISVKCGIKQGHAYNFGARTSYVLI